MSTFEAGSTPLNIPRFWKMVHWKYEQYIKYEIDNKYAKIIIVTSSVGLNNSSHEWQICKSLIAKYKTLSTFTVITGPACWLAVLIVEQLIHWDRDKIMAWQQSCDKPLSEPMMVRSPTHIWATRPQWVKDVKRYVKLYWIAGHSI